MSTDQTSERGWRGTPEVWLDAAYALLVDAKDDQAVAFYQHHGFIALAGQPRTLFLAVSTAEKTLL